MKRKWLGSVFCIGSLALFSSISGFRMEEEAVQTIFDTSSEYMVLSILENEMEVLRREEKNMDVSELPEYVTRYPDLYAPKKDEESEKKPKEEAAIENDTKKDQAITENNTQKDQITIEADTKKDQVTTKADTEKEITDTSVEDNLDSDTEKSTQKIAYLTFDDGPSEQTLLVLDILKEEKIHATFFLIGEEITPEREAIVKRMVEEGHTIGLHTYCHDYDVIYRSVDDFLADYEKLYQRLYEVAGLKPSIFRFPGGSTNRYGKSVIKAVKNEMERRGFCFGAVIIGLNRKYLYRAILHGFNYRIKHCMGFKHKANIL